MNYLYKCVIFILPAIFSLQLQSQSIAGVYERNITDTFICTLTLTADHTFTFHYYQKFQSPNPDKNIYGKGTWTFENNLVTLVTTKPDDFDAKNTLDFSNSKARYSSKSKRDTSNRDVKTALKFYQSDIFWAIGMELQKLD